MFNGNSGMGGFGQPGQRVSSRMDADSELWIPVLQAAVYALVIMPAYMLSIFVDVFLLQPFGLNILVYATILFAAFVLLVGGKFTIGLPIIGDRDVSLPGARTQASVIVLAIVTACLIFLWAFDNAGYNLLCELWYKFWPIIDIAWWSICVPCWNVPIWATLFFVPVSFGIFKAASLLGFRLRYEMVDPMWPPTVQGRSPLTGPYGPDWSPFIDEPEPTQPIVTQTKNGKNNKAWSFYTPPKGVTPKQVWATCCAIEQTGVDGVYTWPGEGNISGVGQKPHRAMQDDWAQLGYCRKGANNVYALTDTGVSVMNQVISEGV